MWDHFHHQADIGVRGMGDSLNEAFAQGAVALMAVICNPDKVQPATAVSIKCRADDEELLFADWLNELIYEMDIRKMLFKRFDVKIDNLSLTATAWGEPVDPIRHETAVDVKAATYMDLKVFQNNNGKYIVQCVVDV